VNVSKVLSWLKQNWSIFLFVGLILIIGVFWWKMNKMQEDFRESQIASQNQIAQLSSVVQESSNSWSRLATQATESNEIISQLRDQNSELASLIESRNEGILQMTTAIGRIRSINIVPQSNEVVQTIEPTDDNQERTRVAFDTTQSNYLRVHGFTLTNPAEANIIIDYIRPINFTVVSTQAEDLSWRTYIQSDLEGLEVGEIHSTVNPRLIAPRSRRIEQDLTFGLSAIVGIRGDSGAAQLDVGYDFGALELGLVGGVIFSGNADFALGGRVEVSPFDI